MALFQRGNPEAALTGKVEVKRSERDKLRTRLADSELAVTDAKIEASQLAANGGDDTALDAVGHKAQRLMLRIDALKTALADADVELVGLETKLANHLDQKQRSETAVKIGSKADRLEKVKPQFAALFSEMIEITSDDTLSAEGWDGHCLGVFATNSAAQIPAAIDLVVRSYRVNCDRVLSGQLPSTFSAPPAPLPVAVAVTELPTTKLIAMKNVCWTDGYGQLQSAGKRNTINVPPATAVRALACGHCQEIGSDFWKSWGNTTAMSTPAVSECINLDDPVTAPIAAAIIPNDPQFEPMDVGKPYMMNIRKEA